MIKVISPFRTVVIFAILLLSAIVVIPLLKVDLLPHTKSTVLSINFVLPNNSPEQIENEVTSIIEEACSQISQLKKISSVSNYNKGHILLEFDKSVDMQYKQFEVTSIIRRIYNRLPQTCSYPSVSSGKNEETDRGGPILSYSIHAPLQPYLIKQESEEVFTKIFAGVSGIKEANVVSNSTMQVVIEFDKNKCQELSISPQQIIDRLRSTHIQVWPGVFTTENGEQFFLTIPSGVTAISAIEKILIPSFGLQTIALKDVAKVYFQEQEPTRYSRINGKSSVSLNVFAIDGENKILVANRAKELMEQAKKKLPENFKIILNYDETEFLEKELAKTYRRASFSAFILTLFIFLAYRNWRHAVNLLTALVISISITLLFAWLFNVRIHLYTIAGIAISLGVITDNAIVMLDYYNQFKDRRIFLALLGASFTTVSALCLTFFLPDQEKKYLTDFSTIIALAILASLITALWFIPSFFNILSAHSRKSESQITEPCISKKNIFAEKRKLVNNRLFQGYYHTIFFLARFKRSFILLFLVIFGLPVFMLPAKWEGNNWYNHVYNRTYGDADFQKNVRPVIDYALGGALRIFTENLDDNGGYRDPEKTKLFVLTELPFGATPAQMNNLLLSFEKNLENIKGIEQFTSNVYSGQNGALEITFAQGFDRSTLPFQLRSKLITKSLDWGGVEWSIYGIGRGFSNSGAGETPSFKILMKGYNYEQLEKQAFLLGEKLKKHHRVQKVNLNELLNYYEKPGMEYVLNINSVEAALLNSDKTELLGKISSLANNQLPVDQIVIDKRFYPVLLKEKSSESFSRHNLMNENIVLDHSRSVRLSNLGKMELRNTSSAIHKEDRQYIRVISFEYMGPEQFGSEFLNRVLDETRLELPMGYFAERKNYSWNNSLKYRKYLLLFILAAFIYFISSVLFENLRQPFFIICMMPASFIGIFLIFPLGNFYFDQGGFASFVFLGGLVCNAAIFIINDFNSLKRELPNVDSNTLLIEAVLSRAKTIILTIISTSCGLIPFLIGGQSEVFWFPLALGVFGGLLSSLITAFFFLPVLMWEKRN